MIVQCQCVTSFTGDAFGTGDYLAFEEGSCYALPSSFIEKHKGYLKALDERETKPLRTALEVKSNNGTSKRARKSRRAKAVPSDN